MAGSINARSAHASPALMEGVEDLRIMRRLVAERRLEEAFLCAERILSRGPSTEVLEALMSPLDENAREIPPEDAYALLCTLRDSPLPAGFRPWEALLRVNLLSRLRRTEEAFLASEELLRLPPRYAWMRILRGIMLVRIRFAYAQAEEEFLPVLEAAPTFWKTRAYIAETALCRRDPRRAFSLMGTLVSALASHERAAALGWMGEMLLWHGDYPAALRALTESIRTHAVMAKCWRAAALFKLGRTEQALADLDAYLKLWPQDHEALVWRGEIRRSQGLHREALEDFDAAVRTKNAPLWAHLNRALARAALKDLEGMWSDYDVLPAQVIWFFQWKHGVFVDRDRTMENAVALMERILEAGGGIRRCEQYLYPLWMDRP